MTNKIFKFRYVNVTAVTDEWWSIMQLVVLFLYFIIKKYIIFIIGLGYFISYGIYSYIYYSIVYIIFYSSLVATSYYIYNFKLTVNMNNNVNKQRVLQ